MVAEREFNTLDNVREYSKKVEPLWYCFKLLAGILLMILSLILVIHIFVTQLLQVNGKAVGPFLNDLLESLENSSASFLATLMFTGIGFYLLFCTVKGNMKLGLRFFCISFYPMVPRETFVNAFFFNALLMNIWMLSLTQFMVIMFKEFVRKSDAALIFEVQVNRMRFFRYFLDNNIFVYILTGMIFISLLYFLLRPAEVLNVGSQVKAKDLENKNA